MSINNILLLCKKSSYDFYFLKHKDSLNANKQFLKKETNRFKKSHHEHYGSVDQIEKTLKERNITYTKKFRGQKICYEKYNTIITVGGDGTFLEAAQNTKNQLLLGINSSPSSSVGKLCICKNANAFELIAAQLLSEEIKYTFLSRIKITVPKENISFLALNDILICHNHPAAMSRYSINIGKTSEEHRNSGIWISTAVGSSGAIHSAGGKIIPTNKETFQYLPREQYIRKGTKLNLNGGLLDKNQKIRITSLMRKGTVFIDGSHISLPFKLGTSAIISTANNPIKTIKG